MSFIINLVRFPIFTNQKRCVFQYLLLLIWCVFQYLQTQKGAFSDNLKYKKGAFSITKKADLLKACSNMLPRIDISPKIAL